MKFRESNKSVASVGFEPIVAGFNDHKTYLQRSTLNCYFYLNISLDDLIGPQNLSFVFKTRFKVKRKKTLEIQLQMQRKCAHYKQVVFFGNNL
jgi:hypothetical protein